jgi:hypothetical protein
MGSKYPIAAQAYRTSDKNRRSYPSESCGVWQASLPDRHQKSRLVILTHFRHPYLFLWFASQFWG